MYNDKDLYKPKMNIEIINFEESYVFLFCIKRELTTVKRFQLMMSLKIRISPHSAVDDMRKALPRIINTL